MRNFLFFALLLHFTTGYSQTAKERREVIGNYNQELQLNVQKVISTFEEERRDKIDEYLSRNPQIEKQYTKDGITYVIAEISPLGTPIYNRTFNEGSSKTIKADALHTGGELGLDINGEGMTAGIWDGGIAMPEHVEFAGGKIQKEENVVNNDHATHVAGTIIAQGTYSKAQGIAPKAQALSYYWDNDIKEMQEFASQGYIVSNHSYGLASIHSTGYVLPTLYFGAYLGGTYNVDLVAYSNKNYQVVKAAGNDLDDWDYINPHKKGYELVTNHAVAKNVLTVAAVEQVSDYTGPSSVKLAYFSSTGPTDDGRIKPNIASKGVSVLSSYYDSTTPTVTNKYATMSGTSMASPAITGGVLLLQQHYNNLNAKYMKSATVRGLLQHTASETGEADGPDYKYGWGLANLKKSVITISESKTDKSIIEENTLENGSIYTKEFNIKENSEPLIVSISWTDLPASNYNKEYVTDPDEIYLVNDLDVRVTDEQGTTYYPWKLDGKKPAEAAIKGDNIVDNFERIDIPNPNPGKYTVTISHKGTLKELNGANEEVTGNQEYSLIVTGSDIETLGVEEVIPSSFQTKIYPVPAQNTIFIQVHEGTKYTIFNMVGKSLSTGNLIDGENVVDISGLSKGIYLIKLDNGSNIETKKIIVQ